VRRGKGGQLQATTFALQPGRKDSRSCCRSSQRTRWRLSSGGQKVKDGPFCPIPTEKLEKMDPERVFVQLERIGASLNWSKKKAKAMRGEFINYRSWCEDHDMWTMGRTDCVRIRSRQKNLKVCSQGWGPRQHICLEGCSRAPTDSRGATRLGPGNAGDICTARSGRPA